MKIGILNADPATYVIDHQTDPEKIELFFRAGGADLEFTTYEAVQGELPESVAVADVFLISGSPHSVYDGLPWISGLEQFIQRCYAQHKKLVGICFGHQLIAQALGGQVTKSDNGWVVGLHEISLYQHPAWLSPAEPRCSLYFVNQDQVVTLPPQAELIGGNELCPHAIYTIGEQVLSIQAHPEQPARFLRAVITFLGPKMGPEVQAKALASLEKRQPDDRLAARWIVNFIASGSFNRW
ncbi:MAG: GMP synthase [Anaerolineae bacterium]|nr:GMP synthase [Anaerolineae bacterium]